MAYDVVSFGGVTLNASSGLIVKFPANAPWDKGITLAESAVRNFQSSYDSLSVTPWQFDVEIHSDGRTLSYATAMALIEKTFNPFKKSTRSLVATYHDGTTQVFLDCYVSSLKKNMDTGSTKGGMLFRATLHAVVPFWQSVSLNNASTTPIVNAGNTRSFAKITMSNGGLAAAYKAYTVTDNTGRGLLDYPVVFSSAITASARHYCFVNGVSVPTLLSTTTTAVWARVDVAPLGTTNVVFFYGSNLPVNPLQGTLSLGSMSNSGVSNTSMGNGASYLHSTFPDACLTWRPAIVKLNANAPSSWGFGMTESATSTVFKLQNPGDTVANDANALAMTVGSATGTTNAFGVGSPAMTRVMLNHTAGVKSFLRYRVAGSGIWVDGWTATADATVTTSIDADDAVEVILGIEYTTSSGTTNATLTISNTYNIALDATLTPTVTAGSTGTVRVYNGALSNITTGNSLTLTNYCFADGTLTFDCNPDPNQRSISNSVTTVPPVVGGFSFSDPVDFFTLDPGSNGITNTITGLITWTIYWRDSYV